MTVANDDPNVLYVAYPGLHAKEVATTEAKIKEINAAERLDPWEKLPRKNLFQFPELFSPRYRCKQTSNKLVRDQTKARRRKFCKDCIKELEDRATVQGAARAFCGISFRALSEGGAPIPIDMAYLEDEKYRKLLRLPDFDGGAALPKNGIVRLDKPAAKKLAAAVEQGSLILLDGPGEKVKDPLDELERKDLLKRADVLKIKDFTRMSAQQLRAAIRKEQDAK